MLLAEWRRHPSEPRAYRKRAEEAVDRKTIGIRRVTEAIGRSEAEQTGINKSSISQSRLRRKHELEIPFSPIEQLRVSREASPNPRY